MTKFIQKFLKLLPLFVFLISFSAFAQGLPVLDAIHLKLTGISASLLSLIAMGLEALFRMIPTPKPLSLLWVGVRAIDYATVILNQVRQDLVDLSTMANKILPADPAAPAATPAPAQPAPAQPASS